MKKTRLLGWALLAFSIYCAVGAAVYFASLLALQNNHLLDAPWFVSTQKLLYRAGIGHNRHNWITQRKCAVPDPELIWVPANGRCQFEDIEFQTVLSFTPDGRETGTKPKGRGIVVIGDSHAMGWGVNDNDTFAAHLQQLSGRPVYNLGVAGYGTIRELMRLEKSRVLEKVDTVILQYCNNDLSENLKFATAPKQELHDQVFRHSDQPAGQPQPSKLALLGKGYGLALSAPFQSLSDSLRRRNFTPHYEALIDLLAKYGKKLEGKRVIVFYSNTYGQKFRNFPEGQDARIPNVHFVDINFSRSDDYYKLDDHLNPQGHRKVAERLYQQLQTSPARTDQK